MRVRAVLTCVAVAAGTPASAAFGLPDLAQENAREFAVAAIAAAWLAFAVWAVVRGARARIQAEIAQAWGLRLRGLLATAPGAYLIVGDDGAASASDTLRGWLGMDRRPASLDDMAPQGDAGLDPEDFAALRDDIAAAGLSGEGFTRLVRPVGSKRVLIAQGRAAPADVAGERGVAVWFRDTTDTQAAMAGLSADKSALRNELEAALAVIDAAPVPIWRRDGAGLELRYANRAYLAAAGVASVEEIVANRAELVQNPMSPKPRTAAHQARDSGTGQRRDEAVIVGEARRVLELHDVPLSGGAVAGFAIDVTARDEARAERDRFEKAQTETLDRLSSGVALFGPDHALAFSNRAFADLFRLDDGFLAERPDFDRVLERMRETRRLPESRDFPDWRRERRGWFTAAGAQEEMWPLSDGAVLRVIGQPRPDGGLLTIFEDRTEQMKLASARDTLVRVQQATLDNLHEAVAVFGADGRLQLSNRRFAEMWSLDAAVLAGRPTVDRLQELTESRLAERHHGRADEVRRIVHTATATAERRGHAARLERIDGQQIDYAAVPLPDGNVLFTYLDVTDSQRIEGALRERNEALEAADRLKSAFVANISYELRTPLTAISGFGEMLAAGYAGTLNDRQGEYVGSILTSAERLQALISDILDLAITEAGELALDIGDVSVADLTAKVAAMAEEQARGRDLSIDLDVDESAGVIEGDERRLKQVFYNLLTNAIRFTPPGGHVALSAGGDADEVRVSVLDDGIGIPEADHAIVFDRFRKGSNAASQGVGLGLALVREFVALHGGSVELSSTVGQGTTIAVRLPRVIPRGAD